ncbi:AMIN domain-containing protein [Oscillatoria sp. CS-180]|uniref:AMIN domain-containing protein n=1 Tax=Oscillatoria sp. CS-180 TaxID=3021720 RepID=UPI00232E20B1|nr:AMIN domain-containing protein [Oscillatoria sp. CS-180]MDB9529435.1 AMIN domain-containing protein [Oscillatoria sp. CS-180]
MVPRRRRSSKSSFGSWQAPSAIALAAMTVGAAIFAPARAAVLRDWDFDTTTHQLTVTLPTGVTPNFFLLAQPARIVLNVPQTALGETQRIQEYSGAIRYVRLSETQNGTRVVLEFAPNTLLDPRHAELTAMDIGNGQTEWTLKPLLQDDATGTIAAEPVPVETPTPVASQPAAPASEASPPADLAPQPVETQPLPEPSAEPQLATEPLPQVAPASESETIPTEETSSDDATLAEDTALPVDVPQAINPANPADGAATAIEIPVPDLAETEPLATPTSPSTIANSAMTGAVRSLPTGPDPMQGVSTDASVLAGVGADNVTDSPPEQLPIDPFTLGSQPSVAVSGLDETGASTAPRVSVPSLAEVPDVPAAPQVSAAPDLPATSPNQVQPPEPDAIATAPVVQAPPPSTAPQSGAIPPPPGMDTEDDTVAMNSMDIPTIPLPPDNWSSDPSIVESPTAVPPSLTPPAEGEAIEQTPATVAPPAPEDMVTVSPSGTIVVPPTAVGDTAIAVVPPPPSSAEITSVEVASNPAPPPFLPETEQPVNVEQPSIPPPPAVPQADGTLPFGVPLPQTKSIETEPAPTSYRSGVAVPEGSRLALQYVGDSPLVLEHQDPIYEILLVTSNVYHPETGELILPSGSQVLGRFEGFDESGRRFVTQMTINGSDRRPLLAESDWMVGTTHVSGTNVGIGSGIGAAAVTLLAGFSGLGLLGGAAIGAATGVVQSPTLVTVEPGQIIEVQVVSEILNFNDAPDISRAYPR